jgi:hypothetical protein
LEYDALAWLVGCGRMKVSSSGVGGYVRAFVALKVIQFVIAFAYS